MNHHTEQITMVCIHCGNKQVMREIPSEGMHLDNIALCCEGASYYVVDSPQAKYFFEKQMGETGIKGGGKTEV